MHESDSMVSASIDALNIDSDAVDASNGTGDGTLCMRQAERQIPFGCAGTCDLRFPSRVSLELPFPRLQ